MYLIFNFKYNSIYLFLFMCISFTCNINNLHDFLMISYSCTFFFLLTFILTHSSFIYFYICSIKEKLFTSVIVFMSSFTQGISFYFFLRRKRVEREKRVVDYLRMKLYELNNESEYLLLFSMHYFRKMEEKRGEKIKELKK